MVYTLNPKFADIHTTVAHNPQSLLTYAYVAVMQHT